MSERNDHNNLKKKIVGRKREQSLLKDLFTSYSEELVDGDAKLTDLFREV